MSIKADHLKREVRTEWGVWVEYESGYKQFTRVVDERGARQVARRTIREAGSLPPVLEIVQRTFTESRESVRAS